MDIPSDPATVGPSQLRITARGRLLFLHVPKTAGTSMRVHLMNQYFPDEVYPATNWTQAAQIDRPITDFRVYSGHFRANFARKMPPDTRTLVVFREPVPRLLSALRHLRRDPDFHPDHVLVHGRTLGEIVHMSAIMANQYNVQVSWLAASADPERVEVYLRANPDADAVSVEEPTSDEALFQRACEALEKIDFIGFTEDLRPVLAQLSDEMGFHPIVSFPRLNDARQGDDPTDELGDAERELILQATALDQRLYDFAKELVEQRRVLSAINRMRDLGNYVVPNGAFDISLREPIPGSGWYEPEADGPVAYRWTGPEPRFTLDLPLTLHDYTVHIEFNRRADDADMVFNGTANMVPIVVEQTHVRRRAYQARFVIPASAIKIGKGSVRLMLNVGTTGRPADHGGADDRLLGIVVFRIVFSPL